MNKLKNRNNEIKFILFRKQSQDFTNIKKNGEKINIKIRWITDERCKYELLIFYINKIVI